MVRIDNKVDRADAIISCCMKRWLLLTNIVSYEIKCLQISNMNNRINLSMLKFASWCEK